MFLSTGPTKHVIKVLISSYAYIKALLNSVDTCRNLQHHQICALSLATPSRCSRCKH